jgi:hypothetical protein
MSGQTSSTSSDTSNKHEGKTAKMTGCVESQGSGYALVDKKHPNGVQLLSSQDLSAHVGHKVEVKGTWEAASASSAGTSGTSGDTSASAGTSGTSGTSGSSGSSAANTGAGTSGSSASSLPQSDQSAMGGQALRVSDIKMKSDKCDMASNTSSNPK